ncbi:MAG TPA: radical SAM family heme chaperone HemW [Victivallales bacterium]|nr:radical SAM family heme chaperone HemW [Victivallales bacterium]
MIKRIYIHIPFCSGKKCDYCTFYSEKWTEDAEIAFLKKLKDDFINASSSCGELLSFYIGGGSPSALTAKGLEFLFNAIEKNFKIPGECEISIELNPEDLDRTKIALIANFANRISLGVQSFNDSLLEILGRRAKRKEVLKAIDLIHNEEIKNFSIDLINSIPGQTLQMYEEDLSMALKCGITHLSSYSLTIEEGSKLLGKQLENNLELEMEIWELNDKVLSENAMRRYEISNFAREGFECKHNLEIWFGDKYLGFGPASASFDGEKRWVEVSDFTNWLNGKPPELDVISPKKRAAEILAFAFRTVKPWSEEKFFERTSFSLKDFEDILLKLDSESLIKYKGDEVLSTERGLLLWNSLAEKIITGE